MQRTIISDPTDTISCMNANPGQTMSKYRYLVEALLCFGPIFVFCLYGLLVWASLFTVSGFVAFIWLFPIVLGGACFWGMAELVLALTAQTAKPVSPNARVAVFLGVLISAILVFMSLFSLWEDWIQGGELSLIHVVELLILVPPPVCAVHLMNVAMSEGYCSD